MALTVGKRCKYIEFGKLTLKNTSKDEFTKEVTLIPPQSVQRYNFPGVGLGSARVGYAWEVVSDGSFTGGGGSRDIFQLLDIQQVNNTQATERKTLNKPAVKRQYSILI